MKYDIKGGTKLKKPNIITIYDAFFYSMILLSLLCFGGSFFTGDVYFKIFFIFISICFDVAFLIIFLSIKNKAKVYEPDDIEWGKIYNLKCFHYTTKKSKNKIDKGDGIVNLKTTKSFTANLPVRCANSVYFFLDLPNEEDISINDLNKKKDYVICVNVKDLNRSKVRLRGNAENNNRVLVHIGPYKGKGEIQKHT
jgi:hypothetical protein